MTFGRPWTRRPLGAGEAQHVITRFLELLGGAYKSIIIYNDGGSNLVITTSGSGTLPDTIQSFLNTVEFSGATVVITSLSAPALFDVGGVGDVLRTGYLACRRVAVTLTGNDQTINIGAGNSGFIALSDGGGARTGLRMDTGDYDGQIVTLAHVGSNNITFHTTEATSRVAGSATTGVISSGQAVRLIWDGTTALWYHVKPMT